MDQTRKLGDTAVDGLFAGLWGGAGMLIYLVGAGLLLGDSLTDLLVRFDLTEAGSPFLGILTHLAVSMIYGVVLSILSRPAPERTPSWLLGGVLGAVLFLAARTLLIPGTGLAISAYPTVHLLVGHVIYGFLTVRAFQGKS
jgi:hypothetical protein